MDTRAPKPFWQMQRHVSGKVPILRKLVSDGPRRVGTVCWPVWFSLHSFLTLLILSFVAIANGYASFSKANSYVREDDHLPYPHSIVLLLIKQMWTSTLRKQTRTLETPSNASRLFIRGKRKGLCLLGIWFLTCYLDLVLAVRRVMAVRITRLRMAASKDPVTPDLQTSIRERMKPV